MIEKSKIERLELINAGKNIDEVNKIIPAPKEIILTEKQKNNLERPIFSEGGICVGKKNRKVFRPYIKKLFGKIPIISIASYNINTSWTTVLTSSSGFNRDVHIQATTFTYNGLLTTVPCDIRMLDKNGNVLWTGTGSVPVQNQEVTFWCGSDVYKVQIRTQAGNGIVYAW